VAVTQVDAFFERIKPLFSLPVLQNSLDLDHLWHSPFDLLAHVA
jgi:hypothetical protein